MNDAISPSAVDVLQLKPLNVAGAYTTADLPDDLDPRTASPITLLRHGLMLRRPDAAQPQALWDRAFSRKWLPQDRIVPELAPRLGRFHRLGRRGQANASTTSNNWAGGVIQGNWASVTATWIVPTVGKPTEPQGKEGGWNSASWAGIDGFGTNDVLQAGIEQQVDGNGNATYSAWYEWFHLNKFTFGDTSDSSPALASLGNRLYIAWRGRGNEQLNVMVSTDGGQTFGGKFVSSETTASQPALTAHNGAIYLGWKGSGNDNLNVARINEARGSITGLTKFPVLGDTSPSGPALASLDGRLFIAWHGNGNNQLNVMSSADNGQSFGSKFVSNETSPRSPSLATQGERLIIAWSGSGNDQLNLGTVDEAGGRVSGLSKLATLGDTSPVAPAIAATSAALYLAWKGDGNDQLNVMKSLDGGHSFVGKDVSPETSPNGPALAIQNNQPVVAWSGNGNNQLNTGLIAERGNQILGFSNTPDYVWQTDIANFPVKPGDTVTCLVSYISNHSLGQILFGNTTTGKHFSIVLSPPPGAAFDGDSIEWIMEAPDGGLPTSSLPKFTPVSFTGAGGCSADGKTFGNAKTAITDNITDSTGKALTSVALADEAVTVRFTG